jgi:hypothetical protein
MPTSPVHHRIPRAGLDPIGDATTALATVAAVVHRPFRHETIVLLLDAERRGIGVFVVTETEPPDAVLEVVEFAVHPAAHGGRVAAMIVASVRPGGDTGPEAAGDVDRWLEMSDIAEQAGVEVLEWFVVGRGISCPRDRLGEPPRW